MFVTDFDALQINQVLAKIEQPQKIIQWMDSATLLSPDWATEIADGESHTHAGYRGRLVNSERKGYLLSKSRLQILAKYLEGREWTAAKQKSGGLKTYTWKDVLDSAIDLKSWRSFIASSDDGRCSWRTSKSVRESGDTRTSNWAKVSRQSCRLKRTEVRHSLIVADQL